ncbi:TniB family NTP-binding protein [Pseudomonas palleroniana]|uniref:TniB family NTP-binding protein n=1 Tax=Pseudomonas palleroniana TaxID=191390 RepID=UPI001E35D66B|nr:TniB family NTP-binding protein [Pseudomonas palleroniana]
MDLSHVHCSCHKLFELSNHDRAMSCLKDFFVPHPSAERLFKKMDMIMSMPRKVVAPCLLCLGQGGVGKTSMIEELGRRNITSVNRIVTVTMHQNADNMGLKELILAEMGLDTSRRARQSRRISPDLQHLIKSQNIKAIVIDEVHDALTLSPFQRKVNLSLLKNLSGSTYGLSVFAFGVPDAARFLREDPQLARRYAVHDLETWSNGQDVRNFVFSYIHRLPLKKPTDFRDQELCLAIVEKSLGITDNIVKILQASAWAAIADGTERITLKHVRDVEAIMSMELGTSLQGLHDVSMEQDCA